MQILGATGSLLNANQQSKALLLGTTTVLCTLVTVEALAQFNGGGMSSGRGFRSGNGDYSSSQRNGHTEKPMQQPGAGSPQQIEYRLALFKDDLKLSSDQENAWNVFASKVRLFTNDINREKNQTASYTAKQLMGLDHVRTLVDSARNRLGALEDVEMSASALYKTLLPSQI